MAASLVLLRRHGVFCTLSLLHLCVLSASVSFRPPLPGYDITSASLWGCYRDLETSVLHEGLGMPSLRSGKDIDPGIEIVNSRGNWVEIISSKASEDHFASLGLDHCTRIALLSDLVADELRENFETLQHHVMTPDKNRTSVEASAGFLQKRDAQEFRSSNGAMRKRRPRSAGSGKQPYAFDSYLNSSAMKDWYEKLSAAHPSVVTLNPSIGKTFYGRDIFALHFTDKDSLGSKQRPKIYVQCLLHPREWITGPVCMYLAEKMAGSSVFAGLLRKVEVVMVPVANPDGYYVTWYNYPAYRLWRKNVRPLENTKCAGVDLNRNFDSHWNSEESRSQSSSPCGELYAGTEPNSELEVQAITRYLKSLGPTLIGAIDYHSYSQGILYPPAWSDSNPEGIDVIARIAQSVASATSQVGVAYTAARMVDIYSASGTFADWLLDLRTTDEGCGSLVPLTIELRPTFQQANYTTKGFMLPQSEIHPACMEMLIGFTEFAGLVLEAGKNCYNHDRS